MYENLVKILRVCGDSNNSCENCPIRESDGSCPHGEWEFAAEKFMLQAADVIEKQSAANVRPVVRAKWEADGRCSNCHYILPIYTAMTEFYFCPNCGADMREQTKEERKYD